MKEKNKFKDFKSLSSHMQKRGFHAEVFQILKKTQADNPALLFNKLLPCLVESIESIENTKKHEYLKSFKEKSGKGERASFDIPCKRSFIISTAYRLAIGMGYPSLIENGLLFHHTYGIPYIPGETLKGLARGVFLLSVYEAIKEEKEFKERLSEEPLSLIENAFISEESKKQEDKLKAFIKSLKDIPVVFEEEVKIEKPYEFFRKVFGTQTKRGEVIFFDAFPTDFDPQKHFDIDIMNPHYSEYYGEKGKEPPADWYNPVPIHFLTVAEGVKFKVCLDSLPLAEESQDLLEKIEILLKVGLENFGVGGKRRKGYGWFY